MFSNKNILFLIENMNIGTINIRYENNHDGENSWSNRRHLLAKFIMDRKFDFIGTQEGRKNQILDYFINKKKKITLLKKIKDFL